MHTEVIIFRYDVFLYASEILFETPTKFKKLDFIRFGSGDLKYLIKTEDIENNIEIRLKKLSEKLMLFCGFYGKELTLALSPRKFLVSESGIFFGAKVMC